MQGQTDTSAQEARGEGPIKADPPAGSCITKKTSNKVMNATMMTAMIIMQILNTINESMTGQLSRPKRQLPERDTAYMYSESLYSTISRQG